MSEIQSPQIETMHCNMFEENSLERPSSSSSQWVEINSQLYNFCILKRHNSKVAECVLARMTLWPGTLWPGHFGQIDLLARNTLARDILAGETVWPVSLWLVTLWPKCNSTLFNMLYYQYKNYWRDEKRLSLNILSVYRKG